MGRGKSLICIRVESMTSLIVITQGKSAFLHINYAPCQCLVSVYRRIFVYTFCLINICLSLSDDANKIQTLNIERA